MKTLKLSTSERMAALGIFNDPQNRVATEHLKVYLDDVDKFRIKDEEKPAIHWQDIKADEDIRDDNGNIIVKKGDTSQVKWDDKDVDGKEISVDDFTAHFLQEKLKSIEHSAVDPLVAAVLSLMEKLS